MTDGGKGDKPRPIKDREKFDKNWDSIFKKDKDELEKYQKQAKELWFKGGSCTGGNAE